MIQFNHTNKQKWLSDKLTIVRSFFFIAEECWTFFFCVLLYRREFTCPSAWGLSLHFFVWKSFYICYKYNFLY